MMIQQIEKEPIYGTTKSILKAGDNSRQREAVKSINAFMKALMTVAPIEPAINYCRM